MLKAKRIKKRENKMRKQEFNVSGLYRIDNNLSVNKYTVDNGKHYINLGQCVEALVKYSYLGVIPDYADIMDTISYNIGDDMPELNASIKTLRYSLMHEPNGSNKAEYLDNYFNNCHSKLFLFGYLDGSKLSVYEMNANEFRLFNELYGIDDRSSQTGCYKCRGPRLNKKRNLWLEWLEKNC